jgi:hypothetical protein
VSETDVDLSNWAGNLTGRFIKVLTQHRLAVIGRLTTPINSAPLPGAHSLFMERLHRGKAESQLDRTTIAGASSESADAMKNRRPSGETLIDGPPVGSSVSLV